MIQAETRTDFIGFSSTIRGKEYAGTENFKKAFIKTATRYAEFVEAKIISAAEVKITLPKEDNLNNGIGMVIFEDTQPTVSQELCEEVRTLTALAAEVFQYIST